MRIITRRWTMVALVTLACLGNPCVGSAKPRHKDAESSASASMARNLEALLGRESGERVHLIYAKGFNAEIGLPELVVGEAEFGGSRETFFWRLLEHRLVRHPPAEAFAAVEAAPGGEVYVDHRR